MLRSAPLLAGRSGSELSSAQRLHLPSGCFSGDVQEVMPEKQGRGAAPSRRASARRESAEAAACGRRAAAVPACRSSAGSSDTPGVAVDSTQGACGPAARRHTRSLQRV